jgi:peptide/nickel transport system permease protein
MAVGQVRKPRRFEGLRRNLRLFVKSKIGLAGAIIIGFFVVLALFSPYLAPNNPVFGYNVSSPYSVPEWATVFPRYENLATTSSPVFANGFSSQGDISAWQTGGQSYTVKLAPYVHPGGNSSSGGGSILVNATIVPKSSLPMNPYLPGGQAFFSMSQSFQFTTKPPTSFVVNTVLKPVEMQNVSVIYINYILTSPHGNYSLSSVQSYTLRVQEEVTPDGLNQWKISNITSGLLPLSGLPQFGSQYNPASVAFNETGTYKFTVQLEAVPSGNNPRLAVYVSSVNFHILGRAYGLLGTDNLGRDLWSQFVWGSQVSLLIGVLSGVGAVLFGTIAGMVAGYLGGWADEALSRVTDFFLVLPFLPLAIILVFLIGQNPILYQSIYFWVIILFIVLSWPTIAKIIRGQVLSVKERQFVEASRAVGGGPGHIIRRHILPNVMGLVYSQMALNVSGFILLEAALDFLAIGIHPISTITWGLTLTNALSDALTNATVDYAWWWFLPPGIAIAALSLAFVLVGFALDQIFNPRLRAR